MAHETQVTGKVSEMTAARALLANGWEVADPVVAEVYDLVAKDPANGEWYTVQIKTLRKRSDRNNELVVYARKGNGQPYQPQDCDYIIGVDGDTAYMFECRGISEYWSSEATAKKRWIKLTAEEFTEPNGESA